MLGPKDQLLLHRVIRKQGQLSLLGVLNTKHTYILWVIVLGIKRVSLTFACSTEYYTLGLYMGPLYTYIHHSLNLKSKSNTHIRTFMYISVVQYFIVIITY